MSEPVDPNAQWRPPPPPGGYQPPPPFAPPAASPDASWPGYAPPHGSGQSWLVGPDGRPVQAPWAPPQPPSHQRRNVIIAVLVVVVLAAAGVGAYFAFRDNGSSSDRIAVPQSFAGYDRLTNAAAQQVEASIRGLASAQSGPARQMFDAAAIGVYAHNSGDRPVLVALVLRTSAAPTGSGNSPAEVADGLLAGASTDVSTFGSGPHGGATRCGPAQFGAAAETMCAWSDPSTTGLVVSVNPPVQVGKLAAVSRAFRDQVD